MPGRDPPDLAIGKFRRKDWLAVLVWPLLGLIVIAALWVNTVDRADRIRRDGEQLVREQATAAVNSYAQQLGHTVEQIDQITLRLKYAWEDPDISVNLEKEYQHGLFPESQLVYANIFNASGDLVTSSLAKPRSSNVDDLPYFQAHKEDCCLGLLISPPSTSILLDRPIVRFTRRLNRADGSFDGVAFVSVEPPYLVSFQIGVAAGKRDFITVRHASGPVLATRVGGSTSDPPVFYREAPVFPSPSGILLEPAEKFTDGQARYIAWNRLEKYPMVALAGFSVHDALAPYEAEARDHFQAAIINTAVLLALSAVAAYFAARLVKRRRQSEETQETYRLATDAANEGFYMIRPLYNRHHYPEDFRIEDCNNRAAALIGATRHQLVGMKASELEPKAFGEEIRSLCLLAMEKSFLEEEIRVSSRSPLRAKWVFRRIVRSPSGLALTIRDISDIKEQEQALSDLANNDTLTKLPNRHWLNSVLPHLVDHAGNGTGYLAVLFIDLDNFKNVNDTLGHDAGDELLVQAAERLKRAVRASDHVARLGGDEFVIILQHVEVVEDVSRVAKSIIHSISKPFALANGTGNEINASIGISMYPTDGTGAETLLKHADIAMYAAKAAGKGRYVFYQSHLSDSLILRLSKERALKEAVDNDQFIIHYQPRVGIDSGEMTSMEALVRWNRPEHGMVYPIEFIGVAEDMGLIVRLGELVIEKVAGQIARWKSEGLPLVPVSINVSAQQLKCGTLGAYIADCIARHGVDPKLIEVELTESAVIDRSLVVTRELELLRSLGIKLMIDDFGTGYSSMAQLHTLDVDVLKVDQAFTKALSHGTEGKLLFGAIISMANALDMSVVAEGVETSEELHILKTLACDEIQGHFVSKAVAAHEMEKMMSRRLLLAPTLSASHPFTA